MITTSQAFKELKEAVQAAEKIVVKFIREEKKRVQLGRELIHRQRARRRRGRTA